MKPEDTSAGEDAVRGSGAISHEPGLLWPELESLDPSLSTKIALETQRSPSAVAIGLASSYFKCSEIVCIVSQFVL